MQRKESQIYDPLRKLFENVGNSKRSTITTLKSVLRHNHEITTKGMELTPKLSTDMFPVSLNSPLMLFLMDFSLKTPRNGSGSLGTYRGKKKE
jgi:hypothetical protein